MSETPGLFDDILAEYATTVVSLIARVKTARLVDQLDLAVRSAHSIKGSAAQVGARRVAELAAALEAALRDGDAPRSDAELAALETAFSETQAHMKAAMNA